MFKKLYEQLWDFIDPTLYAVGTSLSFGLWIAIFWLIQFLHQGNFLEQIHKNFIFVRMNYLCVA